MLSLRECAITWWLTVLLLCIIAIANAIVPGWKNSYDERVKRAEILLKQGPLIDGHNDLAYLIRTSVQNQIEDFPFHENLTQVEPYSSMKNCHTDLPRLQRGQVRGQFWSAYVPCASQYKNAVTQTLEQIDVIKRLINKYTIYLKFVTGADDMIKAQADGKVASMIGVEGGHSMDSSLAVLRTFYNEGVRYMTLTEKCNTPWVESSAREDSPEFGGLTVWGETVIKEMNRLGMMVDLSHVTVRVMNRVLDITKAPVIFSHSGTKHINDHPRNVPDDVLRRMAKNGGVVMITFEPTVLTPSYYKATMSDLIGHINYVRKVAGVHHVGLGGEFNGIFNTTLGMEDVTKYPIIFAELMKDGTWSDSDLLALAGYNIVRAFKRVEEVRDSMVNEAPYDTPIPTRDLDGHMDCVNPYS